MKKNHLTGTVLFSLTILFLLTGCVSNTLYIVHHTNTRPRSPYKFKFYIEDIQVILSGGIRSSNPGQDNCEYANITLYCFEKSQDEAEEKGLDIHTQISYQKELVKRHKHDKEVVNTTRAARKFTAELKQKLATSYPDFFTNDRTHALPVKFQYRGSYRVHSEANIDFLISSLLFGLTPAMMKVDSLYYIQTHIGKIKENYNFTVRNHQRSNLGLLGLFLPTCYLIPVPPDPDEQYTGMLEHQMLLQVTDKMMRAFCYALMELDRNEIYRFYNRNYTPEVIF
ncbi:MAG: hypothetical protein J6W81_00610 [Lentisphaeria bacterium]|nr:hypothetical protein [Lentisphaeria bacterium]